MSKREMQILFSLGELLPRLNSHEQDRVESFVAGMVAVKDIQEKRNEK